MELLGNFFDMLEQMICESVMSAKLSTDEGRQKAVAVRDVCTLLLKIIDGRTLDGDPEQMIERLSIAGGALTAGLGLFAAIGAMNYQTQETRQKCYKALSNDADGFAQIIAAMMAQYLAEAKRQAGATRQ